MSTANEESKDKEVIVDENKNGKASSSTEHISEYKRQKNIISGIDNGHLALVVGGIGAILGGIAVYPQLKEFVGNIMNKNNQQIPPPPSPPLEEPYIPPTPPLPPNPEPVQQQPPIPTEQQQPQEQPNQGEDNEIPDTFYDDELKKRRQLITGKRHLKYDSQFGAGIANS